MAKFDEVFKDTKEIFEKVISDAGLNHVISIGLFANNDLKTIAEVKKAPDLYSFRTKKDVDIVINELIFEQLPEELKYMQAEEIICPISVNMESGKVTINKPDVQTHSGFLSKFGIAQYQILQESVKTLFQDKQQKEEELKNTKTKMKQK